MNVLSTYLWKEWREQRATLGLLALALTLGTTVVLATLPRAAAGDPITFLGVVVLSAAATVLSVGADLLSRERERGLRFLERQPAGLAAAFRAKLAFLVLAMGAALSFGVLLASCAAWLRGGTPPELDLGFAQPLGLILVLSLWTFAVSAWMPSSALTLPATALLLAALAWPALPVILRHPLYDPTETQVWIFAALGVLGAPASAWAAFVVGSRAGRTRSYAACAGLAVAAAAFAPSWVWAASRHLAARNAPLEFRVAWAGENGRFAFVNAARVDITGRDQDMPWTAVVVDLADGSWRFAGPRDASAFSPPYRRDRSGTEWPCTGPLTLFDKSSGEPWGDRPIDPLTAEPCVAPAMDPAPTVGPSSFGLAEEPQAWSITSAGVGLRIQYGEGDRQRFRYLGRDGRLVSDEDLPRDEHGQVPTVVLARPGRWLVHGNRGWLLFDPEPGAFEPWRHKARAESLGPLLEDGGALLNAGDRVHLLDVESGMRCELLDPAGEPIASAYVQAPSGGPWSCVPADRASLLVQVVEFQEAQEASRLAWFDPRARTLTPGPLTDEFLRILWSDGPRAIVLEGTQRIALHDLERNERRVILDAADVR